MFFSSFSERIQKSRIAGAAEGRDPAAEIKDSGNMQQLTE
jgi:hypothetical protein